MLVLMYHRICERTPRTTCYFARGTAVTPARFREQLAWLRRRFEVVPPDGAMRPGGVALTFDDGYRDVLDFDLPPSALFPIADHHADSRAAAWVDAYYALLHGARVRRPAIRQVWAVLGRPEALAPALDEDLRWWVRGPLKEALQTALPVARDEALGVLERTLDAEPADPAALYLSIAELRALRAAGHVVGGHGATHRRLTLVSDGELDDELRRNQALLDEIGAGAERPFCYPDGAHDERVRRAVAAAGFTVAFTVEAGRVSTGTDRFRLPRLHVRDVSPDSDEWLAPLAAQGVL
jgi:peptidoglycan/xylan/chitin deacetylase (PgdA/CDA1 family)